MRWRRQRHHAADPSFLFSTWPIPEWTRQGAVVTAVPVDAARMREVVSRLGAIGGGVVRLSPGDYYLNETVYLIDGVSVTGRL